jgi:hypothetical protein
VIRVTDENAVKKVSVNPLVVQILAILKDIVMHKMLVPRELYKIPEQWHFAPVLDTGEFLFLSGITGVHPDLSVSDDPPVRQHEGAGE